MKQLHLLNTFAALVLPTAASGYMIFLLKGFFDSLPQELFEAGQINARLDKRRAAIAAFERFLATDAAKTEPELARRASALLQELRRGLN